MKEMVYQAERKVEVLHEGTYQEYKFAILNLGTHPTGYVECKIKDLSSYDDDRVSNIDVHGGFTFYDKAYWNKDDNETYYLGWDYAHYGDYVGYYEELCHEFYMTRHDKKWTTQEVYKEVKSVINQLKESED